MGLVAIGCRFEQSPDDNAGTAPTKGIKLTPDTIPEPAQPPKPTLPTPTTPPAPAPPTPTKPTPAPSPKPTLPTKKPTLLSINDFRLIGAKPGGSVPGGLYEKLSDGKKYIIKYTPHEVAVNEVMASEFYRKAGLRVANYLLVDPGPDLANYKIPAANLPNYSTKPYRFVAVEFIENLESLSALQQGQMDEILDGFIIDAWMANYDTIGLAFDNIMKDKQGHSVRVDIGASLEYRAQGSAKGLGFNDFAYEIVFLLNRCDIKCKNYLILNLPIHNDLMAKSNEVFKKLSRKNINAGLIMLNKFDDKTIADIVKNYGPKDPSKQKHIVNVLVKRKEWINNYWRNYLFKIFPH